MGRSGGGGHSGGSFGGGHSGGSFGGSRSGGSFGGGRSSSGSRGSSGGGFRTGPIFVNNSKRYYGGGGGGGYHGGGGGGGRRSGCGMTILTLAVFAIVLFVLFGDLLPLGGGAGKSTVQREALSAGMANTSGGFYADEAGWISDRTEMESGLRYFYQKTGVAPFVYIANSVPGAGARPSASEMTEYAAELYSNYCSDEAHFLLVFYDYGNGQYICGYNQGTQTKAVMDDEAVGILGDYIDQYYNDDMTDEEFFSKSFEKTADRIMTVTRSPWPYVVLAVVIALILYLLFVWWKKHKEQKNLEAKQTEDILKTPLEKFGDQELSDLEKKYGDEDKQ